MIPITKNIKVVDEQGNEYEATYPKRAKGLVKQGRARFIDESTLCIACPPNIININLEDKNMSDINDPRSNDPRPNLGLNEAVDSASLFRVLNSIENLISNADYIKEAINNLKDMDNEDIIEYQTDALLNIVRAREETNREALNVLKKLVEHLTEER